MRPEISPEYPNNRFTKEVEEQFNFTADILYGQLRMLMACHISSFLELIWVMVFF